MKSLASRIWTRIAVSISYDDNHYTTGISTEETCYHSEPSERTPDAGVKNSQGVK